MKRILLTATLLATLAMCALPAFAAPAPFIPEVHDRFLVNEAAIDAVEARAAVLEALPANVAYTTDGISNTRIARATYDVAVDLGTIAPHLLGVSLPAKALVKQVWFQIITQFIDAGSGTVAIHCEDADNLYAAADITGMAIGTTTAGVATGAAADMVGGIAAACELTATVAGAAQTAGKLIVYVEYVIID